MIIQPIVEGKGEIAAVRQLLFRLMTAAGRFDFQIAHPIRRTISQLLNPEQLRIAIQLAQNTEDLTAILILFDGDIDMPRQDDIYTAFCPKLDAPPLANVAKAAAGSIPCELVVAVKEFESWLIAGIEGIRGLHGIPTDACCPINHENIRDAKGTISAMMPKGSSYSPMTHQAALTSQFELAQAYRRSRSFRKLAKAFADIHADVGSPLINWPPPAW